MVQKVLCGLPGRGKCFLCKTMSRNTRKELSQGVCLWDIREGYNQKSSRHTLRQLLTCFQIEEPTLKHPWPQRGNCSGSHNRQRKSLRIKGNTVKIRHEKSRGILLRLLIEHDRSDPSDSLQTPEGLTNEKSMTTTSELCVTVANVSRQCYSDLWRTARQALKDLPSCTRDFISIR